MPTCFWAYLVRSSCIQVADLNIENDEYSIERCFSNSREGTQLWSDHGTCNPPGNPVDLEQTQRLRATVQRRAEMEAAEAEARAALAKAEEERLAREAGADDAPPPAIRQIGLQRPKLKKLQDLARRPMDAWKVQEMMSALTSAGLSVDRVSGWTDKSDLVELTKETLAHHGLSTSYRGVPQYASRIRRPA